MVLHFFNKDSAGYPSFTLSELSAHQLLEFALYDWPGNVRELQSAVQKVRLGQSAFPQDSIAPGKTVRNSRDAEPAIIKPKFTDPKEIDDRMLLDTLDSCDWVIKTTASKLNVSRTSLYAIMARSSVVRRIEQISDEEIHSVVRAHSGGLGQWARQLRVGRDALRRRLKQLGIDDQLST